MTRREDSNNRRPRVFWANCHCILDQSSGASLASHEILLALVEGGHEVRCLGASNFDAPEGIVGLGQIAESIRSRTSGKISFELKGVSHELTITRTKSRMTMTAYEEAIWLNCFKSEILNFKPDVFLFWGGQSLNMSAAQIASARGIPVVSYIANGNYFGLDWCQNVDLAITDSSATAELYRRRVGITAKPVGSFIRSDRVIASLGSHKYITFVNPVNEKGALIMVGLVALHAIMRPDIQYLVVESRGKWSHAVKSWEERTGRRFPANARIRVLNLTNDMRTVYAETKILVVPSLWHESGGRIVAEAALNGIPSIVSDSGGLREFVGGGGIVVEVPHHMRKKPYNHVPEVDVVLEFANAIETVNDNSQFYETLAEAARKEASKNHSLAINRKRLIEVLEPLVAKRAGNLDQLEELRKMHKLLKITDSAITE